MHDTMRMKGGKDGRLTIRKVPRKHVQWLNKRAKQLTRESCKLRYQGYVTASDIIRALIEDGYDFDRVTE